MRAAIFIDGGYVLTQFKQNRINPDYTRLPDYLLHPLRESVPLDLLRCYFYYCPPWISNEPTEDELRRMETHNTFVSDIERLSRWSIRLGKLQKRWDGQKEYYEQKRVDVLLSIDMVRHAAAGHIQHAILVAGDSDFIPAVEATKDSGVTLTLWCGRENTVHKDLIRLADEVHTLQWRDFPQAKPITAPTPPNNISAPSPKPSAPSSAPAPAPATAAQKPAAPAAKHPPKPAGHRTSPAKSTAPAPKEPPSPAVEDLPEIGNEAIPEKKKTTRRGPRRRR